MKTVILHSIFSFRKRLIFPRKITQFVSPGIKCRNIELSEESLKRHYDLLFVITKYFIDRYLSQSSSNSNAHMWFTDIYHFLHISSSAGDKILDRLEFCWGYIDCLRSRRYRSECFPTVLGLAALFRRQEYREKLLKQYEGSKKIYKKLITLNSIFNSFKSEDELNTFINDLRNAIFLNKGFLTFIINNHKRIKELLNYLNPSDRDKLVNDLIDYIRDNLSKPPTRTLFDLALVLQLASFTEREGRKVLDKAVNLILMYATLNVMTFYTQYYSIFKKFIDKLFSSSSQ